MARIGPRRRGGARPGAGLSEQGGACDRRRADRRARYGGANGIVGASTVAKATPDGYTLLVYSSGIVINPYAHRSMPYDTATAFTPITNLVSNGGLLFAVANSVPAKNLQEFIDYAKKPDTHLAYSTPGVGNTWHLAMEVFDHMTGLK